MLSLPEQELVLLQVAMHGKEIARPREAEKVQS